jgi:copper homeostasis protein
VSDPISIEICVDSAASAHVAELGGANRVELCSNLLEGGVTPSAGLIEFVRDRTSIGLQVMIRPRAADFCYSEDEFETMRRDILVARKIGADGVVLGILHPDGRVDVERTGRLVELARPLTVTFHRAVDVSEDIFRALDDICAAGVDRILTSGGAQTAVHGIDRLARLVRDAQGRIAIMAGGGVRENNAASIIERTGVKDIHSGLGSQVAASTPGPDSEISSRTMTGVPNRIFQVLQEDVRRLREAVAPARI